MDTEKYPFDRCDYLLPAGCKDLVDSLRLEKAKGHFQQGQKVGRVFLKKLEQKELPVVYLPSSVVVRDLAKAVGAKLYHVINVLKQMGAFTSVEQRIPFHTAAKVAKRYGYISKRKGCHQAL